MKISYDITLLGRGHYEPVNRTGTFRVVENLAYGLASVQEVELSFYVGQSLDELDAALEYLKSNHTLTSIYVNDSIIKLPYKPIKNIANKLNKKSDIPLVLRVVRRILNELSSLIKSNFLLLSAASLNKLDIFHSPCFALTPEVKNIKSIKRFITIYDLIPILYPKYFNYDAASGCKNIIHSLAPSDWAICISEATKNDLCNYDSNIDPARVFVTPLAASTDVFYPCENLEEIATIRQRYSIPDAPYILSLCTLEPRKNIDSVIRCFAKLVHDQNIQDLYLVLVGTKGWSYSQIFQELADFDLTKDRVILTGYVGDEDLAALYSGALAFTYVSFYEGFGLPPLEAMQCGVPVITSNNSSLPEVVGDAGIMLDASDADGLCQSMFDLYRDSALRESMSLNSIDRAKQFSWEKCTQATLAAYKTALLC
jgi:glycosyltransferase involved in cell wall biosynthesis